MERETQIRALARCLSSLVLLARIESTIAEQPEARVASLVDVSKIIRLFLPSLLASFYASIVRCSLQIFPSVRLAFLSPPSRDGYKQRAARWYVSSASSFPSACGDKRVRARKPTDPSRYTRDAPRRVVIERREGNYYVSRENPDFFFPFSPHLSPSPVKDFKGIILGRNFLRDVNFFRGGKILFLPEFVSLRETY